MNKGKISPLFPILFNIGNNPIATILKKIYNAALHNVSRVGTALFCWPYVSLPFIVYFPAVHEGKKL